MPLPTWTRHPCHLSVHQLHEGCIAGFWESRNVPVTMVRALSIKEGLGRLLANQWQSSSEASLSTLPNQDCISSLNAWRMLSVHDSVTLLPLRREYLAIIRWRAFLNGLDNLELWIWLNPAFFHEPIPLVSLQYVLSRQVNVHWPFPFPLQLFSPFSCVVIWLGVNGPTVLPYKLVNIRSVPPYEKISNYNENFIGIHC